MDMPKLIFPFHPFLLWSQPCSGREWDGVGLGMELPNYSSILQQGQALLCTPRTHCPTKHYQQLWIPKQQKGLSQPNKRLLFPSV